MYVLKINYVKIWGVTYIYIYTLSHCPLYKYSHVKKIAIDLHYRTFPRISYHLNAQKMQYD